MKRWEIEATEKRLNIPIELFDLIPGYLDRRLSELSELRTLAANSNFDKIRMIGHKLKGNGVGYGFNTLSEIGSQLERSASLKDLPQVDKILERLDEELKWLTR